MQIGRREHYMIHAALYKLDLLERLFVDIWFSHNIKINNIYLKKLRSRNNPLIDNKNVTSFNINSIINMLYCKYNNMDEFEKNLYYDNKFQKYVLSIIENVKDYKILSFASQSYQLFQKLHKKNYLILDIFDPGKEEDVIVHKEYSKWKNIIDTNEIRNPNIHNIIEKEIQYADEIIVNSEWSKECIEKYIPSNKKIVIIPLCYERQSILNKKRVDKNSNKLKVLWLGTVCLRKGFMYLLEAARLLENSYDIEFNIYGNSTLNLSRISIPKNVNIHKSITKEQIPHVYITNDLFILPTLSDGFAITQIEAQSYGLPLIVSDKCGKVVKHNESGLIINPYDPEQIAESIKKYYNDSNLLSSHKRNAAINSKRFSFDNYTKIIKNELSN